MAEKWIINAFTDALPTFDGKSLEDFADHVENTFTEAFPAIMAAYEAAFGDNKAMKFAMMMLADTDLLPFLQCFFTGGYHAKEVELDKRKEEGGQGDA